MKELEKKIIQQYNKRRLLVALMVLPFVVIIAALGGYFSKRSDTTRKAAVTVAATITPIADMVRNVGGERVDVKVLLLGGSAPSALPAMYTTVDLTDALVVFGAGHGLDNENMPQDIAHKFYSLDRNVNVLLEEGSTGSPYYWLSLKNAQSMVATITDKLIEIDPEGRIDYELRRDAYIKQLQLFDTTTAALMKEARRTQLAVYGYDWQYFADDYGLRIVAAAPPDKLVVGDVVSAIQDYNLSAIFSDIALSPAPLLPILDERNVSILYLDAFGGVEDRNTYLALMSYNARTIFEGLNL